MDNLITEATPKPRPTRIPDDIYRQLFNKDQIRINEVGEMGDVEIPPDFSLEWFDNNVDEVYKPYREMVERLVQMTHFSGYDPQITVSGLSYESNGWFVLTPVGWEAEDYPDEDAVILDFETKDQKVFCGAAVGDRLHVYLSFQQPEEVVSIGDRVRVLVGHNLVQYDRAFVKECYSYQTPIRCLDTLSMHNITKGLGGKQIKAWLKLNHIANPPLWVQKGTPSSLSAIALSFLGVTLDKSLQDTRKVKLEEIQGNWAEYLRYCLLDAIVTHEVFKTIMGYWFEYTPNWYSIYAMMEKSTMRLEAHPWFDQHIASIDKYVNDKINTYKVKMGCTFGSEQAPITLKIHWKGKPLKLYKPDGRRKYWYIELEDGSKEYLPHPEGKAPSTGNPLGKNHAYQYRSGELEIRNPDYTAEEVLGVIKETRIWTAYKSRLCEYKRYNGSLVNDTRVGTLTRRGIGLFTLLPHPRKDAAGSEISELFVAKHMFVGSDYDAQEIRIAGAIEDADSKYSGGEEFGRCALVDDFHTITAKAAKLIDSNGRSARFQAKAVNFSTLYGAGVVSNAQLYYKSMEGTVSFKESLEFAQQHYQGTKGQKLRGQWGGGILSNVCNLLDRRAQVPAVETIIFKHKIADASSYRYAPRDWYTTRTNYSIQGTGQDLVDMAILVVRMLTTLNPKWQGVKYNLAAIVHDEVLFDTPDTEAMPTLLQLGHLLAKCAMYRALKIHDFPTQQAWFKEISIRKSLTKKRMNTTTLDLSVWEDDPDLGYSD